jgi:hypothetical protein
VKSEVTEFRNENKPNRFSSNLLGFKRRMNGEVDIEELKVKSEKCAPFGSPS